MSGEGFKLAVILVACFMITSMTALVMLGFQKTDVATLKELFGGLGTLAAMFGIPSIITAWIVTRGRTTGPTLIASELTPETKQ